MTGAGEAGAVFGRALEAGRGGSCLGFVFRDPINRIGSRHAVGRSDADYLSADGADAAAGDAGVGSRRSCGSR